MPPKNRASRVLGKVRQRLRSAPGDTPANTPATAPRKQGGPKKKARGPRRLSQYQALPGDRLLEGPVFVLSSIRSGSTLLRVMLNTHSQIHAPHEMHLFGLQVDYRGKLTGDAMQEVELDEVGLEFLLMDRVLHRELTRHGKAVVVSKTPSDSFRWRRIRACWPDARFIFLLRHPAAIADSWSRAKPNVPMDRIVASVLPYMKAIEEARGHEDGLTVRYEDITTDPEREMRRICDYIGVPYEPAMLDYGQADHGSFKAGLGDWSDRIRSGKVQAVEELPGPDEIPAELVEICRTWGYLQ